MHPDAIVGRVAVAQVDPGAAVQAHRAELDRVLSRVLDSGVFLLGAEVEAFEAEFAAYLGGGTVVSCANGTDALELSLRALGIGPGDAVAAPSLTAVATIAAIERAGAEPCLVDIEPGTYTLDVADLIGLVERRSGSAGPIRAVVAVHLYGQAVDLDPLVEVCRSYGLKLVEDCAQAHGGRYAGGMLGTFGEASAFSFYPTKNLGALGDGGAVWLRDPAAAERVGRLRQYGWDKDRVSLEPGQNSRLDALQAAILRTRLPRLEEANARRRAIAAAYDRALDAGALAPPTRRPGALHAFHQYVVRTPERDAARRKLSAAGVQTAIHYRVPVHRQPAYRDRLTLGPAACRESDAAAAEILSLPMFPEMTDEQLNLVVAQLLEFRR